jgi:hypothetical protein
MFVRRVACAALLLIAVGCGVSQAELREAKSALEEGLEVWKKGGKPADLTALPRPVELHEAMWSAGTKLLSYEVGTCTYQDREKVIRCEARLTVRDRKGKQKTENVVYDIKLGPPVKIINNPMP